MNTDPTRMHRVALAAAVAASIAAGTVCASAAPALAQTGAPAAEASAPKPGAADQSVSQRAADAPVASRDGAVILAPYVGDGVHQGISGATTAQQAVGSVEATNSDEHASVRLRETMAVIAMLERLQAEQNR